MADLKYYFVVGPQKTGTTLLARLLDSQPAISCLWESYALNPRHPSSVLRLDSPNRVNHGFSCALIERLLSIWQLDQIDYFFDIGHRYRSFAATMPPLLNDFAERSGSRLVGDKWPWYLKHIHGLLDAFPKPYLIHVARDPRAIWNSAQRFQFRERGDVVLWEVLELERIFESLLLPRSQLTTVRYEDIVSRPLQTVAGLLEFLGMASEPARIQLYLNSNLADERWSWVPEAQTPILGKHSSKWNSQMSLHQIMQVEELARAYMEKYGYHRLMRRTYW